MHRRQDDFLLLALAVLTLLTLNGVTALTQKYCSSENTASDSANQSIYQSNGACITTCAKYAFGVVQGEDCWCSNYIPSDQQSIGSCNEKCPGYPYEYCGNSSTGLYGYVAVGNAASGTAGAGSTSETVSTSTQDPESQAPTTSASSLSTSIDASTGQTTGSSTSTQASSAAPSSSSSSPAETTTVVSLQTVDNSVTETVAAASSVFTSSKTPSSDSAAASSTLSTSITKSTPYATTVVSSIGGVATTVVITATPSVQPEVTSKSGGGGISKGAIAGVAVAAFATLGIVAFGLIICIRRRKRDEYVVDSTGMVTTPSRMGSQMSRNNLLGNPFRSNSISHTQHGSSDGGVSPISPVAERRLSKPLVFDQRLNPDLYLHEDSSRVSINTIEDHRDYNRRLNIRNPDPEDRD